MSPSVLKGCLTLMLTGLLAVWLITPAMAQDSSTQITVRVDGLSCPFCAYGLEKKLTQLEGAASVRIDIEHGVAVITLVEGKTIEENRLRKAVEDSGFTPRKITYQSLNP